MANLSQFMRSTLAPFMDRQKLQPFKPNAFSPPKILGMTEDDDPEPLQQSGGSFSGGGGSGGSPPSMGGMSGGGAPIQTFASGSRFGARDGDNAQNQVVDVNYGHFGSGKVYSYYAKNLREGQTVTATVTHYKSKRDFKTLAVVKRVTPNDTQQDVNERRAAAGLAGIALKTIDDNDVNSYVAIQTKTGRRGFKIVRYSKNNLKGWQKHNTVVKRVRLNKGMKGKAQYTTVEARRTDAQTSAAWRRDSKRRWQAKINQQTS